MKVLRWLDDYLEECLLGALLAAMAVIMGIQVFCRYALGMSLSWSEELTRYLFIWAGFLSISYCIKLGISIKIEQFIKLFPKQGERAFKLLTYTIELVVFLYLLPYSWRFFYSSIISGQTSPALEAPMYLVQAAPLVGFTLAAVRIIEKWIRQVKILKGRQ